MVRYFFFRLKISNKLEWPDEAAPRLTRDAVERARAEDAFVRGYAVAIATM